MAKKSNRLLDVTRLAKFCERSAVLGNPHRHAATARAGLVAAREPSSGHIDARGWKPHDQRPLCQPQQKGDLATPAQSLAGKSNAR